MKCLFATLAIAFFLLPRIAEGRDDAPVRETVRKSLGFLEKGGVAWIEERKCASCHHVPFLLWSHNAAAAKGIAVDDKKLAEWTRWTIDFAVNQKNKKGERGGGGLDTIGQLILGRSGDGEIKALKDLAGVAVGMQRDDGSWHVPTTKKKSKSDEMSTYRGTAWASIGLTSTISAQDPPKQKRKKKRPPFRWVNPLKRDDLTGVGHAVFRSPSMKVDVGYCIYLPPGYEAKKNNSRRYPVVYYLHGGRPGSETKSVGLAAPIHQAISAGRIPPAIYVFVNSGKVSHYNHPESDSLGEDVFIKELIPHVDATYRTIAERRGRALEGFSQGGRGTARIMFRHPELFCSAAPGGGGFATEKRISENDGWESDSLRFAPGYNAWDLAREYAKKLEPKLRILVFVGDKGFNYENNLEYMKFLESLEIPFERLIVPGAPHSAKVIYEKRGEIIMKFHAGNFK